MTRIINLVTVVVALTFVGTLSSAHAAENACDSRVNDNFNKLLECVTLDGVRAHQAALQAIADANGGTRAAGTPGYDASVDYVVEALEALLVGWGMAYAALVPVSWMSMIAPIAVSAPVSALMSMSW